MSVEIGTAYVSLVPSMKGFTAKTEAGIASSGLGSAVGRATAKPAERAGTEASGFFSRAFARAQQAGGSGIYVAGLLRNLRTYGFAISGVVGLTVGLGLKTASAFQQANVAFTTTLGSARKAKALFAQLVQFAKVTPFNLPNVVAASQKLLAFGFAAKKIKPILTSLGDAAAGLSLGNEGLDRLTVAVGQISAKGRLQSDELLQLTEAGVPALRILGNEFGLSTARLQKYVTKGLVPASKAIPALLSGIETGTKGIAGSTAKFGGLMAKQSKTLGGIFSNLKDSLTIGLARASKPLVPILERAMPKAAKAIGGAMRRAATDMAEFLHGLGVAKDKSKGAVTGFETLGTVVRGVAHVFSATAKFVGKHVSEFALLGGVLLSAVAALKVFNIVMAITDVVLDANPVGVVVFAIGALAAAFAYCWHKSETFRNVVKGVFRVLEFVVGHYAGVVITMFRTILRVWTTVVGAIVDKAAAAFGWVPGVGHKLRTAAKYFDNFRSSVDAKLGALANDAFNLGAAGGSNFASGFFSGFDEGSGGFGKNGKWGDPTKKAAAKHGEAAGKSFDLGALKGADKNKKSASTIINRILGPLRALKQAAAQLASSVTQAILGDTGFGAILNATDAFGQTGFGTSVKAIIAGFVSQRRDVFKFRRELRELRRKGLSDAAVGEIAAEGVTQGGQIAEALVGASTKQLHRISKLRADTHSAASDIGTTVARDKYGKRIAVEIARTTSAVERAAKNTNLSDKTVAKLGRAFDHAAKQVKPYVRVGDVDKAEGRRVAALV